MVMPSGRRFALISVFDKIDLEEDIRRLVACNFALIASGGTAKHLRAAGFEVMDTAELISRSLRKLLIDFGLQALISEEKLDLLVSQVGQAILGHKVVTLSREIAAALLANSSPEEQAELERLGVPRIALVYNTLYPLEAEIAKPGSTRDSVIEQTDIGGPTMLREAAKGRRLVASNRQDFLDVLGWLEAGEPDPDSKITELVWKAELTCARYCAASAHYHSQGQVMATFGQLAFKLAYAENRWQGDALVYDLGSDDPLDITRFQQLGGADMGWVNLTDLDRLLHTVTHIVAAWEKNLNYVPYVAVAVKHGNACGAAVGRDKEEVIRKMVEGNPGDIMGAFVMVNFALDFEQAKLLRRHLIPAGSNARGYDGVVAPSCTEEAIKRLSRDDERCRILVNPELGRVTAKSLDKGRLMRKLRGALAVQNNYDFVLPLEHPAYDKSPGPVSEQELEDLLLAWAVCATSTSNTITAARNGMLIANGVGQQSRVRSAKLVSLIAGDAGHTLEGCSVVSDSFFPFADGPLVLVKAGVKFIFATSGSKRDQEVRAAILENGGVTFWTLPDAMARIFFHH